MPISVDIWQLAKDVNYALKNKFGKNDSNNYNFGGHYENATDLKLPKNFSLDNIRKSVYRRYGNDYGFIVVEYGSAVEKDTKFSDDRDFIVLVHCTAYSTQAARLQAGIRAEDAALGGADIQFDIHKQIFDSLLMGCIIGKPYEVSIAIDGKIIYSEKVSETYLDFVRSMVKNLIYHPHYIADQLRVDANECITESQGLANSGDYFSATVNIYWAACCRIQSYYLRRYSRGSNIRWTTLYFLSKYRNLGELDFIKSREKAQDAFYEICKQFKRRDGQVEWDLLRRSYDDLMDHLNSLDEEPQEPYGKED